MTRWVRTFAGWSPDGPEEADRLLAAELDAVRGWPIEPIRRLVSNSHATPTSSTIYLAETRAIVLAHPNPFPEIRVFP